MRINERKNRFYRNEFQLLEFDILPQRKLAKFYEKRDECKASKKWKIIGRRKIIRISAFYMHKEEFF